MVKTKKGIYLGSKNNPIKKQYHTKFNEKIFIVRLKRSFKKASMRELQLTITVATQEITKRQKGLKK